jgi:4-hydroxy-tetrahydrodipicolinate reductase
MGTITILGDGALGRAIAVALAQRGEAPRVLGRPPAGGHEPGVLAEADLVVDASRGDAVLANVRDATAAGCRRFVIATTGWQADADEVAATLRRSGAAAVAAPNLSIGAAVFLRLAEAAARLTASTGGFEPSVVEWHRRAKADRPSGTAREIVRRLAAWSPIDVDEIAVVRSGWMPGHHAVMFDGPSETLELRLTSRDRSGYAAGALVAIDWLRAARRSPGIHPFDEVVDALFEPTGRPAEEVAMNL